MEDKISFIIISNEDNIFFHKTIKNILNEVNKSSFQIKHEIILYLNNNNQLNEQLSERYHKAKIKILQNGFDNSGKIRNFAVNHATGNYITFIDAGDLISSNWISCAYEAISTCKKEILIHPESTILFGQNLPEVLQKWENSDSDKTIPAFFEKPQWSTVVMGKKEIFDRHPFKEDLPACCNVFEEFYLQTLQNGVFHQIIKSTVHFSRRKNNSYEQYLKDMNNIPIYSHIFDKDKQKNIEKFIKNNQKTQKTMVQKIDEFYVKARNVKAVNSLVEPVANFAKKALRKKGRNELDKYIIEEWKKINQIENQLFPEKYRIRQLIRAHANDNLYRTYLEITKNYDSLEHVDYIFIVPWIIAGGADKVLLNYIKAMLEINPQYKIAVISTLPVKNTWAHKIPKNVLFFDFGNHAKKINHQQKNELFSKLIVQTCCKKIHIINSEYGYLWIKQHYQFLKAEKYEINLSLFCNDIIRETHGQGIFDYADPYAIEILGIVNKIYTDNKAVIKRVCDIDGFSQNQFQVHYQPNDMEISKVRKKQQETKLHILWASKVSNQKNPELLCEIGKKLDPELFQIDVYGRFDAGYSSKIFQNISSIKYHGEFNGISSLQTDKFDVFLYTSLSDGLPNVLLEITSLGLPIIASNVGGISEFIQHKKTGILVYDNNADSFVENIKKLKGHSNTLMQYAKNAQKLLKDQHGWDAFVKEVDKMIKQ